MLHEKVTPEHTALREAHLWTQRLGARGHIVVAHPNGVGFEITRSAAAASWFVYRQATGADGVRQRRGRRLASIPCVDPARGFLGCVQDTLRVAGPEARAHMDQVLLAICLWAGQIHGHPGHMFLLRSIPSVILPGTGTRVELPEGLRTRLQALSHVLLIDPDSGLLNNTGHLSFDLPRSHHERLELMTQLQDLGMELGP